MLQSNKIISQTLIIPENSYGDSNTLSVIYDESKILQQPPPSRILTSFEMSIV